jgi:hypothetical protein
MTRPCPRILVIAVLVASALLALGSVFSHRASAAEWEELPVVPTLEPPVLGHLEKVVTRGQAYGNRLGVFAKIGDSITASPSFLQGLACRRPRLGTWNALRGTLDFFGEAAVPRGVEEAGCAVSNSYSRVGVAAVAGWRAVDALAPLELPECQGLPAVSCELHVLRPSVALIMFGTNDLEEFTAVEFRRDLAPRATAVLAAGRAIQRRNRRSWREPGAAALELLAADDRARCSRFGLERGRGSPERSLSSLYGGGFPARRTSVRLRPAEPRGPPRPRPLTPPGL